MVPTLYDFPSAGRPGAPSTALWRLVETLVARINTGESRLRPTIQVNLAPGLPPIIEANSERLLELLLAWCACTPFAAPGAFLELLITPVGVEGRESVRFLLRNRQPLDADSRLGGEALPRLQALAQAMEIKIQEGGGAGYSSYLDLPVERDASAAQPPAELIGKRALLCEDNAINAVVSRQLLQSLGLEVRHVATGGDALVAFDGAEFDFALLDARLPDRSGLEIAAELRAKQPLLPIVIVTADAVLINKADARRAGASELLYKPYRRAEMQALLIRCQQMRLRAERRAAGPPESGPD